MLQERPAAHRVEAELARSRRHGTALTLLVLEPDATASALAAAVERVSPTVQAEIERLYLQRVSCRRISEQVRRTDVVVCSAAPRFFVLSTETDTAGATVLADRITLAIRDECGIELRRGIAEYPLDGTTYVDLLALANAAANGAAVEKVSLPTPIRTPRSAQRLDRPKAEAPS